MKQGMRALSAVAAAAFLAAGMAMADGNKARVRVVHASPDAPVVDVLVNDSIRAFTDAPFEGVTGYAPLPAGMYNFKVVPSGEGPMSAVIDVDQNLFYNRDYTVVAVDVLGKIEALPLVDKNRPAPRKKARVRFVHASPDAPAVDVAVVNGPVLFENLSFKGVGDYKTVPRGIYDLEVRLAGTDTVALEVPGVMLRGGTTYTFFAMGFAAGSPDLRAVLSEDSRRPRGKGN